MLHQRRTSIFSADEWKIPHAPFVIVFNQGSGPSGCFSATKGLLWCWCTLLILGIEYWEVDLKIAKIFVLSFWPKVSDYFWEKLSHNGRDRGSFILRSFPSHWKSLQPRSMHLVYLLPLQTTPPPHRSSRILKFFYNHRALNLSFSSHIYKSPDLQQIQLSSS